MVSLLLAACLAPPPGTGTSTPPDPEPVDTDAPPTGVGPLVVAGFNVESGGSDITVVADETVATLTDVDVWGFNEVESDAAAEILAAAAGDLNLVVGTTGWEDLLALAWDDAVLAFQDSEELEWINVGGTVRAPLVGHFVHVETRTELLFVVNHLWRTDDAARHEQATLLHDWAAEQTLPVIFVGDYNFDWDVSSDGEDWHDPGYDNLTAGGVVAWVKLDPLETTQCSTYYDSVLDFTFVAGAARDWPASAAVPPLPDDYCTFDTFDRSDHKPVVATFEVGG